MRFEYEPSSELLHITAKRFVLDFTLTWHQSFFSQNLRKNYQTNALGRDRCVAIFLARFFKETRLVPDLSRTTLAYPLPSAEGTLSRGVMTFTSNVTP